MKKHQLNITGAGDFCARSTAFCKVADWEDPESDFEAELFAALASEANEVTLA